MKQFSLKICWLFLFLSGCIRHEYKKQIVDGYYLFAYSEKEDMMIVHINQYAQLEVIGPTVFSIGFDSNFIIAKQHPAIYPEKENKKVTNYFIIVLRPQLQTLPQDSVLGPLDQQSFHEMEKKLNVPRTVDFSLTFKNLD